MRLGDGRPWALYAALTLVALYTSFTTVGMLLAHGLFVLLDQRRPTRTVFGFGAAMIASGLLFLPWALALVRHFEAFQASMRWSKEIVIPNSSLLRIQMFNASRTVADFWPELETALAWLVTAVTVTALGLAVAHVTRHGPARARGMLLLLIAVPIGLMLGPDLLFGGIRSVSARYMTPSWIAIELALAWFVSRAGADERVRQGLLAVLLAAGIASCWSNAGRDAVWTKGTSSGLPRVAELVNAEPSPLVIGDNELHHPGNLLALSNLLGPTARMQFLTIEMEDAYVLPEGPGGVFLFSPIPPFRDRLDALPGIRVTKVYEDLYVQLWQIGPE